MKLLSNYELKTGDYLSIELSNNELNFFKDGVNVGCIPIEKESMSVFKKRKLKAVVKEVSKGEYKIQILRFADLHRHSGFSLLDGTSRIEDLVNKTEYAGALTDHGNMHGFLEYYKQMKKASKQPIIL